MDLHDDLAGGGYRRSGPVDWLRFMPLPAAALLSCTVEELVIGAGEGKTRCFFTVLRARLKDAVFEAPVVKRGDIGSLGAKPRRLRAEQLRDRILSLMQKTGVLAVLVLLAGCGDKGALYKGKPVSYWRKALQDTDVAVRREAVAALGTIGAKAPEAIPDLVEVLKDPDEQVRAQSAAALWSMGPVARDAVPALIGALKDPKTNVRLNAAGALGEIGPPSQAAVPALIEALWDPPVCATAIAALGNIGPEARTAVPTLVQILKARDRTLCVSAASALGGIGPDAVAALPALKEALTDNNGSLRNAASAALKQIGGTQ